MDLGENLKLVKTSVGRKARIYYAKVQVTENMSSW